MVQVGRFSLSWNRNNIRIVNNISLYILCYLLRLEGKIGYPMMEENESCCCGIPIMVAIFSHFYFYLLTHVKEQN